MLAATERLRRSGDFAATVRGGRRAGHGTVVVHLALPDRGQAVEQQSQPGPAGLVAAEERSAATSRAGFVVSKAVGGAVTRNLVRRRLRHLVRTRLGTLPEGSTLVVRALPAAAEAPYARLGTDLDAALSAARAGRGRGRRPR